jgi:hypothetical protein
MWGSSRVGSSLQVPGIQGVGQQRGEARFMVLTVEPCPVPSLKRSLHRKIKKAGARAGLKTHTPNDLTVSGTQLVFQEKVVLEQEKLGWITRKASQR